MAAQNFPFAFPLTFDADKLTEMFGAAKLPGVDTDAVMAAQKKNVEALIEANQVVIAGYQDLYKRQVALFEAAVAETKDKLSQPQGQPLTADQASQSVEAMKTAFEKAAADVKELAEVAQKANTGAFEIVKARAEEAAAEFKAAAEKTAA
ncbi:MAG: phasin family protein [Proteobacteria bacterium]|nr:phasin family protein [Pseudomonadota bacterium]